MAPWPLYLASASPRRRDLLRQVGLAPIVRFEAVDESPLPAESALDLVRRLAEDKGRKLAREIAARGAPARALILAADTAVVLDGELLGKPAGPAEAEAMLRRLRARPHEVVTGVFLLRTDDGRAVCDAETTRVVFGDFDDETIRAYVAGGEPLDKAGAYGIQGRGALLAPRIEGSWANVVGLPVERLPEWFRRIDVDLLALVAWGEDPAQPRPISAS